MDTQIETALMMKGIFKLPLRALEGFFSSVFTVINIPLKSFTYTCMNQW
nr:transposase [Candidatus Enterovibrio escacola]